MNILHGLQERALTGRRPRLFYRLATVQSTLMHGADDQIIDMYISRIFYARMVTKDMYWMFPARDYLKLHAPDSDLFFFPTGGFVS